MRVAIGGFVHETNTFHPLPTTLAIFRGPTGVWVEGDALLQNMTGTRSVLRGATLSGASAAGRSSRPSTPTAARPPG